MAVSVGLLSLIRSNFRRSLGVIRSRSAVGSSFRSAVICGAVPVCLVASYLPFLWLLYRQFMIYLLTVCGRSVGVLWFAVCPESMQIGGLFPVLLLGALSPLPSFLESRRNCSAAVIPSAACPMQTGRGSALWLCLRSFCGLLLGRCLVVRLCK